ncbi:MAG: glycosyltransferase [Acidobacteria bacterium]|nr:glycosyltransferase [Acidobacteriota bacterium]MBV9474863.1 glycosyltransferase [Acidobacteriota bacterium]
MILLLAALLLTTAVCVVGGYAAWLLTAPRPRAQRAAAHELPHVLIVVPVFDEAALIERKLENLAALTYAPKSVVLVDGGSSDGSVERIARWIDGRDDFALLATNLRDKTAQINEALRVHRGAEWILATDADALLAPNALDELVAVAASDASIGVVGTRVRPASAHALEALHWRATDWLRERESARGSAGIVAAPCYLARRALLADLPSDTIADDVHVACRAMSEGLRVGHGATLVVELRSPRTLRALLRHKYRKADAYLREIFRFLPRARQLPAVFLWRAALLTLVPLLATLAGVALVVDAAQRAYATDAAALLTIALAFALLFTARPLRHAARFAALAFLLIAVSAAALLAYPWSRQIASFPKILSSDELS